MKNIVKENRIGRFQITQDAIRQGGYGILALFSNFIIVRAEALFRNNTIEYFGYSKMFDETPEECVVPEYKISISEIKDIKGDISFSFTAEKQGV